MKRTRRALLTVSLLAATDLADCPDQTPGAQGGLDPAALLKPLGDSWPTYSGDYTGRRYSSLTQINQRR
jgi:alcohol dehydrogenase (cytochrome c)